jgi:hypothetical protein
MSVIKDGTDPHAPAPRVPCTLCLARPTPHALCLVSPAPRAMHRLHLALRSAAPRASRPDSHCAQPRSMDDLRAVASIFVPALSSASTSLHWATSRWTHVTTLCFMRFRCMLHMFYLDVAKVDLVLHMLQCLYTYVASVCFKCFRRMLQVAYLDVAYVALAIHVCCKCMFSNVSAISNICSKCFIWMLQML